MANQAQMVAASQQRQKIPAEWQIEFQDWTDDALLSLSEDETVSKQKRAYAQWELDFRIAFEVPEPRQPKLQRRGSALETVLDRTPLTA
jgi:hypothetical protein